MKKIFLALLVASSCLLSSCVKENIIFVESDSVKSFYIDAYRNHWIDNPDLTYIYATFAAPEITEKVIQNGIIVAYYIDNDERDNMLPYLLPYYDEHIQDFYYENVRFDVSAGEITFIIEDSDFNHANIPNKMKFKVAIAQ